MTRSMAFRARCWQTGRTHDPDDLTTISSCTSILAAGRRKGACNISVHLAAHTGGERLEATRLSSSFGPSTHCRALSKAAVPSTRATSPGGAGRHDYGLPKRKYPEPVARQGRKLRQQGGDRRRQARSPAVRTCGAAPSAPTKGRGRLPDDEFTGAQRLPVFPLFWRTHFGIR